MITKPEPAIIHFKTTRKSGFACIALLCGDGDQRLRVESSSIPKISTIAVFEYCEVPIGIRQTDRWYALRQSSRHRQAR